MLREAVTRVPTWTKQKDELISIMSLATPNNLVSPNALKVSIKKVPFHTCSYDRPFPLTNTGAGGVLTGDGSLGLMEEVSCSFEGDVSLLCAQAVQNHS